MFGRLEKSTLLPVLTNVRYGWPFHEFLWVVFLIFMPGRSIESCSLEFEQAEQVSMRWFCWRAVLRFWCSGSPGIDASAPATIHLPADCGRQVLLRWILTILILRASWSTRCRENSRPRILKLSTTLSMWRLDTGVSSILPLPVLDLPLYHVLGQPSPNMGFPSFKPIISIFHVPLHYLSRLPKASKFTFALVKIGQKEC